MGQIISIKKMRQNRNQDIFIDVVLNDPARLARIKAKQVEAREKAKREAEEAERKAKANEAFQTFALKLSITFSVCVTTIAALVVFLC